MIQIIHGTRGSGKTKQILDLANQAIKEQKGDILFVDDDNRYMFDVRHEIRFVNAGDYGVCSPDMFYGFICGMLAQNFDISCIYVDAFMKLVKTDAENTKDLFERLTVLSAKRNVNFVISASVDAETAPEFMRAYFAD